MCAGIKLLHTADWHLGMRQYGSVVREHDMYATADAVADAAIAHKVDAVIIAGDLFDAVRPPARATRRFREIVDRLRGHGIGVYGIDGNHDYSDGDWFATCGAHHLGDAPTVIKSSTSNAELRIKGVAYSRPAALRETLNTFAEEGEQFDILVLHQEISEMCGYSKHDLAAAELAPILSRCGVKYVALGHIHTYGESEIGGIRWAYPGSLEITDRNEPMAKYVSIVTWDGKKLDTTVHQLQPREFMHVSLDNLDDIHALIASVTPYTKTPVVVGDYLPSNKAVADSASELLTGAGILHNFRPIYARGVTIGVKTGGVDARKSIAEMLRESVDDFFDTESDQHSLVRQLLHTPARTQDIVLAYAKDKGVIV